MATFREVLAEIQEASLSPAERGGRFERLILQLFREDPLYQQEYRQVWLWGDWPERPHRDLGIDLVAERADGNGFAAIQAKCYGEGASVSKEDVRAFLAASDARKFTARFFITTGTLAGTPLRQLETADNPPVSILYESDLAERNFHWATLAERVEDTRHIGTKFVPRPDQTDAVRRTLGWLYSQWRVPGEWEGAEPGNRTEVAELNGGDQRIYDRGQVLMPCGTGKTFTALNIAEQAARHTSAVMGGGGERKPFRVLYLLPSISLLQQTMREWAEQKSLRLRFVGVCSDVTAGRSRDEIGDFTELEIPVTTDPERIGEVLSQPFRDVDVLVVFSTYHSIRLISDAQKGAGAPAFDLMFCDEAHRTTGAQFFSDQTENQRGPSVFLMPHDDKYVAAKKRVYMTATPKIWSSKSDKAVHKAEVFSMDDEEKFGPVFYRMKFSEAIDKGLLSDYYLVGLTIRPGMEETVQELGLGSELSPSDIAKFFPASEQAKLYGAVKGVAFDENDVPYLRRCLSFTNSVKRSKIHQMSIEAASDRLRDMAASKKGADLPFQVRTQHIDGKTKANIRRQHLDWLKEPADGECRIVTNARCLSEGVDVPNLDAALFMSPKHSAIDIVQQVGRVMRKSDEKTHGYIVVPILLSEGDTARDALQKSEDYATIIKVVRALRSHDDNIDQLINQNRCAEKLRLVSVPERFGEGDNELTEEEKEEAIQQAMFASDDLIEALNVLVFEDCGDRQYWAKWAKDVGERTVELQNNILEHLETSEHARAKFDQFMTGIHETISPNMTEAEATGMLAQHLVTQPVFDAFFENYEFSAHNPVSKIMNDVIEEIVAQDLLSDLQHSMAPFYESVQKRIRGITDPTTRHEVLKELYETFLKTAFPNLTDLLGVVYTPVEIVDWLLHSADDALRQEFEVGLGDKGVEILDPFSGTGTFLTRLIESDLIPDENLDYKYQHELSAIDILPTAYYLSAINIEEAYHGRKIKTEDKTEYQPFKGIALGDTFTLLQNEEDFGLGLFGIEEQNTPTLNKINSKKIRIIIGNPPWRAWQKVATDQNPNKGYEILDDRIADTYVSKSTTAFRASLYDVYLKAIRWASDRIEEDGVIAFVTNGAWLNTNAGTGVRACFAEEFSKIYCYNLRGKIPSSSGDGGNVFNVKVSVTMILLIKGNIDKEILYAKSKDNISGPEKLKFLREEKSLSGLNWTTITPDKKFDWVDQTDEYYQVHQPIGDKLTKRFKSNDGIFRLYSSGLKTNRDLWAYNSDLHELHSRSSKMVYFYNHHIDTGKIFIPKDDNTIIKWHDITLQHLEKGHRAKFADENLREVIYRPFFPQTLYYEAIFNNAHYQTGKIFPNDDTNNLLINISGKSAEVFDCFMTKHVADLHLNGGGGQGFPRLVYRPSKPSNMRNGQAGSPRIFSFDDEQNSRFRVGKSQSGVSALAVSENRRRTSRGYL